MINYHHVWCNNFMHPRDGCKMCKKLFELYPYDTSLPEKEVIEQLLKKHFPNVERKKLTKPKPAIKYRIIDWHDDWH